MIIPDLCYIENILHTHAMFFNLAYMLLVEYMHVQSAINYTYYKLCMNCMILQLDIQEVAMRLL